METFRTVVEIPACRHPFGYHDPCLLVGSCFSDYIGRRLLAFKFPVLYNPFGALFNPFSIEKAIRTLIRHELMTETMLHCHNGLWFSFSHYTAFSHPSRSECLSGINDAITAAHDFLKKSRFLIVTLGTAWIYTYKETGEVVANCHKLPASSFERRLAEPVEIVPLLKNLLHDLRTFVPGIEVIFTVSPIRHFKDGAVGNQVSKSILHLSIHQLQQQTDFVQYFPAYEIFMDELRDYRFYAPDMLHPSEPAMDYVWKRFCESHIDEPSRKTMNGVERVLKAISHRPVHKDSESYRSFVRSTREQIEWLEQQYPFLNFSNEKNQLTG